MLNINHLPDDCLRLIFTQLTLQELVHLRSGTICIRWHLVLTQICNGVKTLKIHGTSQEVLQFNREMFEANVEHFCNDQSNVLILEHIELSALPVAFPRLTNLMISRAEPQEDSQKVIAQILDSWSSSLKTVALFGFPKNTPKLLEQIWHSLSKMTNLCMLNLGGLFRQPIPEHFPILNQIKFMILVHYLPELTHVLAQLKSIQGLILSWIYLSVPQLEEALKLNPNLAQNVKYLNLGYIFSPNGNREHNFRKLLSFICRQFQALEHLNILFSDHLPLSDLIPDLYHLKNLKEIWFYLGRDQMPHFSDSSTECQPTLLLPLRSVTGLYLEIFDLTIEQFIQCIPRLFPNLTKLTLRCPEFDQTNEHDLSERLKREFRCLEFVKLKFE